MKKCMKRRHLSPAESSAEKKAKQLKIENFILPTKSGTDSKDSMSRNASPLSAPDAIEPASASVSSLCLSPNNKIRPGTPPQDFTAPSEPGSCNPFETNKKSLRTGKDTPLSPCHCQVAKHLSEICFISAETLILLLGRLNNIEVHLDSILQLTTAGARRDYQLSPVRGAHPYPSISVPQEIFMTDRNLKVIRTFQPLQIVLNIPSEDSMLWNSKGRILSSLSALLDCHFKPSELNYFFFLPSILNFNRVFLAFRSPYLPKKIFQVAHYLRSLGIIPLRVFKDNEPRALFKTLHIPLSRTQKKGWVECTHSASMKDVRFSAQEELRTLKNKLTELLATSRSCFQGIVPAVPASSNNYSELAAPVHSSFLSNDCDPSTMDLEISGSEPNQNTKRNLELNQPAPLIDFSVTTTQPCSASPTLTSNSEILFHSCLCDLLPVRAKSAPDKSEQDSTKSKDLSIKIPSAIAPDLNRHFAPLSSQSKSCAPNNCLREDTRICSHGQGPDIQEPVSVNKLSPSTHLKLPSSSGVQSMLCKNDVGMRPGAIFLNDPHFDKVTNFLFSTNNELSAEAKSNLATTTKPTSVSPIISTDLTTQGENSSRSQISFDGGQILHILPPQVSEVRQSEPHPPQL